MNHSCHRCGRLGATVLRREGVWWMRICPDCDTLNPAPPKPIRSGRRAQARALSIQAAKGAGRSAR